MESKHSNESRHLWQIHHKCNLIKPLYLHSKLYEIKYIHYNRFQLKLEVELKKENQMFKKKVLQSKHISSHQIVKTPILKKQKLAKKTYNT